MGASKKMFKSVIVFIAFPLFLSAQSLSTKKFIETNFGELRIISGSLGGSAILLNNEVIKKFPDNVLNFEKYIRFNDYDAVLVSSDSNENNCVIKFFFISLYVNNPSSFSELFGDCTKNYELESEPNKVILKFASSQISNPMVYEFENGQLKKKNEVIFSEVTKGSINGVLEYLDGKFFVNQDNEKHISIVFSDDNGETFNKLNNLVGKEVSIFGKIKKNSDGNIKIGIEEISFFSEPDAKSEQYSSVDNGKDSINSQISEAQASKSEEDISSSPKFATKSEQKSSAFTEKIPINNQITETQINNVNREKLNKTLIIIGITIIVGFIILGIVLGVLDKAVFYYDKKDLMLSFLPIGIGIIFGLLFLFIEDETIKNLVGWIGIIGSLMSTVIIFVKSFTYNRGNPIYALSTGLAKIVLSILLILNVKGALAPGGKTISEKRYIRSSSFIWLAVLIPLMYRLVNGERVRSDGRVTLPQE